MDRRREDPPSQSSSAFALFAAAATAAASDDDEKNSRSNRRSSSLRGQVTLLVGSIRILPKNESLSYYSAQYNCPLEKKWDIPRTAGYPRTICIKLDLCICTIPTVGLYWRLGEVTATHN